MELESIEPLSVAINIWTGRNAEIRKVEGNYYVVRLVVDGIAYPAEDYLADTLVGAKNIARAMVNIQE